MKYFWVEEHRQLLTMVATLKDSDVLAIDTEFERSQTFYPRPGLLQISDGQDCYLVDPLAIRDWQPLTELIHQPERVKIFHSASEDIELLCHFLDWRPEPIFDTQIAAAFVGEGWANSYQKLVERHCQVSLAKEQTRSDWLARPLNENQCEYAALDVYYLVPIYRILQQQLQQLGRSDWFQEEVRTRLSQVYHHVQQIDPEGYRRLKNIWKLSSRALVVAMRLFKWREQQARLEDVPRNQIMRDSAIIAIAQSKPINHRQMAAATDMTHRQIRHYGEEIIDIARSCQAIAKHDLPDRLPPPLGKVPRQLLKKVKSALIASAEQQNIASELLTHKQSLTQLIRSGYSESGFLLPEYYQGWRYQCVGEELKKLLTDEQVVKEYDLPEQSHFYQQFC